jgi:hypothetical protein
MVIRELLAAMLQDSIAAATTMVSPHRTVCGCRYTVEAGRCYQGRSQQLQHPSSCTARQISTVQGTGGHVPTCTPLPASRRPLAHGVQLFQLLAGQAVPRDGRHRLPPQRQTLARAARCDQESPMARMLSLGTSAVRFCGFCCCWLLPCSASTLRCPAAGSRTARTAVGTTWTKSQVLGPPLARPGHARLRGLHALQH